jgi:citrate lyase subunit beta/citryl-CoA lyase
MRSKLFIPGSRPDLFPKALNSQADSLSLDLEDAVATARKDEARHAVAQFLATDAAKACSKTLIVRVNAFGSTQFNKDIAAVVQPGLAMINLPKPDSTAAVQEAAHAIEIAERNQDWSGPPVKLLLNIETPQALRQAVELAKAHPRVAGLQLGLADLFETLDIARDDHYAVHQVMLATRMAAGEAGLFAYDSAYPIIGNPEGFRAEAQQARRLGFLGKSCIHPSQIALANEVFLPTSDEIKHALEILRASEQASQSDSGVYTVNGQMVDAPFVARARTIVARARHAGML